MKLDDLIAELFAKPVDQFIASRNARVKQLKADGQADLARQLAGLKKPPVHLWAANRVATEDHELTQQLRESAGALARAQSSAGGGRAEVARTLRAASEDFQQRLDAGQSRAEPILREGGHAASEEALRRVREIFRLAALQGGETWERLAKGALVNEPQPGDDMLAMFQSPGTAGRERSDETAQRVDARLANEAAERSARLDADRAEQAEATARRLRQEAREQAAAAERAEQRAKAAEEEAAAARAQAQKSQRALARRK
jgi:hypothetical protein